MAETVFAAVTTSEWLPTRFGLFPTASMYEMHLPLLACRLGLASLLSVPAVAQCSSAWDPSFGAGVTDGTIRASAVYNDGSGDKLYLAGTMETLGGRDVELIGTWDGQSFGSIPGVSSGPFGLDTPSIQSLLVFDDGSGPKLFVGGTFSFANFVSAGGIASWDGSQWSYLNGGLRDESVFDSADINAMVVFDDGNGPALYAGGVFDGPVKQTTVVPNIAKWTGTEWVGLGDGLNGEVLSLEVFDDGTGAVLVAGGRFTGSGNTPLGQVASWDGSTWTSRGDVTGDAVHALRVFDDGNGDRLYAGGSFSALNGTPAANIAVFDGTSWRRVRAGTNGVVSTLEVFDFGAGPVLHVGGNFTQADDMPVDRAARWNGDSWQAVGSGADGHVWDFVSFDPGSGARLHMVGSFTKAGGLHALNMANILPGSDWQPVFEGGGADDSVLDMVVWDDGSGEALYVGGMFTSIGGLQTNGIAKYDSQGWHALAEGIDSFGFVETLEVFDDGNGEALYVGGYFQSVSGVNANGIVRWNGNAWEDFSGGGLGSPAGSTVLDLYAWDGVGGNALYVAGRFQSIGGINARLLARWDGATWSAMPGGPDGPGLQAVHTLLGRTTDSGPELYAGGRFWTINGNPGSALAVWNGNTWSPVGGGQVESDMEVNALAFWNDGHGEALFVAGAFDLLGDTACAVGRWDGTSWGLIASPTSMDSSDLLVWDDGQGQGEQLYMAGAFANIGTPGNSILASGIVRWNGESWLKLDAGDIRPGAALTLATFDDGSGTGTSLYAGGSFDYVGDSAPFVMSTNLARVNYDCLSNNYCVISPNSAGPGATISVLGSSSITANDLTLFVSGAPTNQFGIFFYGNSQVQSPFGDGVRCVGGSTFRLNPSALTDPLGTAARPIDLTQYPTGSGAGQVLPGSTWHFQFWFRDPQASGAGFNLSDGTTVTFGS